MAIVDVLYTKIVNDENKDYGASFVVPKDMGGGILVVPHCVKAIFEELIGEYASME